MTHCVDLAAAAICNRLSMVAADGSATLRTRLGAVPQHGSTSLARGSWAMACESTAATAVRELLTVIANPCFPMTALIQFVGEPRRLGATAGTPGAALRRRQGDASSSSLGGTSLLAEAPRHTSLPSARHLSSGARRPSGRRRRAVAWRGTLLALLRTVQDEQLIAPGIRAEVRE